MSITDSEHGRLLREVFTAMRARPLDFVFTGEYAPPSWEVPGVYQLIGPTHSYVGVSKNVRQRVADHFSPRSQYLPFITHARALSLFDVGTPWRDLLNAEAHWGMLLQPNLNKAKWRFVRNRAHREP